MWYTHLSETITGEYEGRDVMATPNKLKQGTCFSLTSIKNASFCEPVANNVLKKVLRVNGL